MSDAARRWLRERRDEVPPEFLPWLESDGDDGTGDDADVPGGLERRALAALSDAASGRSSDRRTAFRLLAADAYLTYACEAALDRPDPAPALRALLGRIADRIP